MTTDHAAGKPGIAEKLSSLFRSTVLVAAIGLTPNIGHAKDKDRKREDRVVRLTGEITTESAAQLIDEILELSKKDPRADIVLRINSGGGSVTAGLAIYDVIRSIPNDVRTVCEGNAQSMAAFILMSGTRGKRDALPHCTIMLHQNSWGENGQMTDINITNAQGNVSRRHLESLVMRHSGLNARFVHDMMERNFYPTTQEAKILGFIDNIVEPKPHAVPPEPELPGNFCDNPGRQYMWVCRAKMN